MVLISSPLYRRNTAVEYRAERNLENSEISISIRVILVKQYQFSLPQRSQRISSGIDRI